MAMDRYKLIGRLPVPVADLLEWASWFETADRHVARTDVGPLHVSTVFLGLDHSFSNFPDTTPILFETMIFGADTDGLDHYCDRYASWDEAERGHAAAVEAARVIVAAAAEATKVGNISS